MRHFARIVLFSGLLAAFGCDVDQTQEGEMPEVDVDVEGGQMPRYDVDAPEVEVGTKEVQTRVPDVDVEMEEKTITVPDVDVEMPDDEPED